MEPKILDFLKQYAEDGVIDPTRMVCKMGGALKIADPNKWIIEGLVSTPGIDEDNDIILPSAFASSLQRFMEFPNVFFNHDMFGLPIGKVLESEIRGDGLFVRIAISKTAPKVWVQIQEGILKAFSHYFFIKNFERDVDNDIRTITDLELIEVSVVSLPANRDALFEVAKSALAHAGLTLQTKQPNNKGDEMTEEEIRKLMAGQIGDSRKAMTAEAESATKDAVKIAIAPLGDTIDDLKKGMAEISDAVTLTQTKGELREMVDKCGEKIVELEAGAAKLRNQNVLPYDGAMIDEFMVDESADDHEIVAAAELKMALPHARLLMCDAKDAATGNLQDLIHRFQKSSDELYLADVIMSRVHGYRGPQSIGKLWARYSALRDKVTKAMDTTEHSDWVPTGMSGEAQKRIEIEARVASLFRSFTMPTKTFEWPVLGSTRPTAYNVAEATSDTETAITASTPSTGSPLFTAEKIAVRVLTSVEMIEDSIVALIQVLNEDIVKSIVRGIEDAIINGDADGTHMDSDYHAIAGHVAKSWDGLRKEGLTNGIDGAAAKLTATLMRSLRKKLGAGGADPSALAYLSGIADYIALLDDTNLATAEKFTNNATWLTGFLNAFDGIPLVVSEFCRETLDETGVYAVDTHGCPLCVIRESWVMGDRRMLTLKSEELIATDQVQIVAAVRKDFVQVLTSPEPAAALYESLGGG